MLKAPREASGLVVETHGAVRVLRVDRPHRRNALGIATLEALALQAQRARADAQVGALVLTGTGDVFAAGGDLRDFAALSDTLGGREVHRLGTAALRALRRAGLPLVAAINGDAWGGGCELAAACDVRVMSDAATLHWVQGRLGLTTGWGGAARLVELVGSATALRWLLGVADVGAAEAQRTGFATMLAPDEALLQQALELAQGLAVLDRVTARRLLRLVRTAESQHRAAAQRLERKVFSAAWRGKLRREAMAPFRKPKH